MQFATVSYCAALDSVQDSWCQASAAEMGTELVHCWHTGDS